MSAFMTLVQQARTKGVTSLHFEVQLGDWLDQLDQGAASWEVWTCRAFGAGLPNAKGVGRSGEEALRCALLRVEG